MQAGILRGRSQAAKLRPDAGVSVDAVGSFLDHLKLGGHVGYLAD